MVQVVMRILLALALSVVCTAFVPQTRFSYIIVFGDSLSDNGNGWKFTNFSWPADPAYYNGRFTNGPVWSEYLAHIVGAVSLSDFAYGGATVDNSIVQGYTGPQSTIPVPAVTEQVDHYLDASSYSHIHNTLVILIAGVNDAFFAGNVSVRSLTDSLIESVRKLAGRGHKTFVLPSSQAGSNLPYYVVYNPSALTAQEQFSRDFNGNISLSMRDAQLPSDITIHLWDEHSAFSTLIKEASKRGVDPSVPCLQGAYGEVPVRRLCEHPDKHIFFDIFHPTTKTHKAIAKAIASML